MPNIPSSETAPPRVRGLSLLSGGLDSLLAICVLREQGIEMTAITFDSPFFNIEPARKGAAMLGVPLKVVDYTDDIFELLDHNRYGFGSGMNPCIDCHARMIRRAAEIREAEGFDFVSTGEVVGQRPMSQNRNSLNAVSKTSGAREFLLRPLSAQLLPPTPMEEDGRVDRSRLLALEGRSRKPQMELAAKYGITEYPSPAGGCRLTEPGFAKRLKEMKAHEGLERRALVDLLRVGRHFRLPGGSRAVVGRNRADNEAIRAFLGHGDTLLRSVDVPGPSVLLVGTPTDDDLRIAAGLCARYADGRRPDGVLIRFVRRNQPDVELRVPPLPADEPQKWLI